MAHNHTASPPPIITSLDAVSASDDQKDYITTAGGSISAAGNQREIRDVDESSATDQLRKAIKHGRIAKVAAEILIMAACTFWVGWWLLSPDPEAREKYVDTWIGDKTANLRFFNTDGHEGSSLIFHGFPFVMVTLLSFVVIELRAFIKAKVERLQQIIMHTSNGDHRGSATSKRVRGWRLSTYPVWVGTSWWSSPLGIVTSAEALAILVLVFVAMYHLGRSIDLNFHRIARTDRAPSVKYWQKVSSVARLFGEVSMLPFALLWIPVSRGSPLLRLARIPFEQAVRYHMWLATSMIALTSIHSLAAIIAYTNTGRKDLILEWNTKGESCSIVAGLVAWIVGLVMLLTSLSPVRRRSYEFFFAIHHLYILFSLFWIYHVVSHYHYFIIPILLFFVDRFIRMVQSARLVQVSSVKIHRNGVVELTMPLPRSKAKTTVEGARQPAGFYNVLSTWCIQIPGVSVLQWHFFSGASSPLQAANGRKEDALSVIIKPLGGWTNALRDQFPTLPAAAAPPSTSSANPSAPACPFSFKARVEGPYGDESDFYLKYKSLLLVAGGIGITPVLGILRDILYRYKDVKGTSKTLPTSITIYHCIRQMEDLHVLDYICPDQILPGYDTFGLRIQIHVYITSKPKKLEDPTNDQIAACIPHGQTSSMSLLELRQLTLLKSPSSHEPLVLHPPNPVAADPNIHVGGPISSVSSTGDTAWVSSITIASVVGYFLLSGFTNTVIIKSYEHHNFTNYNRAHVIVACMILGIVIFGGFMLYMWTLTNSRKERSKGHHHGVATVQPVAHSPGASPCDQACDYEANLDGAEANYIATSPAWVNGNVHIGSRPHWKEIFNGLVKNQGGESVGVLVSGSESIQQDVARECKRHSSLFSLKDNVSVIFHYHSVSFSF